MISSPKSAKEILDLYFLENRARILDIASFLDRVDRYKESEEAKADFRYKAFIKALKLLLETDENRTKAIQLLFSDQSTEPIESAVGLKAVGAWEGSMV
jgi:hypothetical protein